MFAIGEEAAGECEGPEAPEVVAECTSGAEGTSRSLDAGAIPGLRGAEKWCIGMGLCR